MKIIPFQIPKIDAESFRFQEDLQPKFYDKLHQHKEVQLTLIVEGEGTFVCGNRISPFKPNDLFLIYSHVPHVFRSDENPNNKNAHSFSLYFDPTTVFFQSIPEMRDIRQLFDRQGLVFKIDEATTTDISTDLVRLRDSELRQRLILFISILDKLSRQCKNFIEISTMHDVKNFSEKEGKRMNDIVSFTFANSHREITIAEIAEVAHLSPEAFCRYFKLRTRKTYINFLNEIRINNACKLLDKNEYSIADISFQAGFNNISNFNRIFKRLTGFSPRNYVKMK